MRRERVDAAETNGNIRHCKDAHIAVEHVRTQKKDMGKKEGGEVTVSYMKLVSVTGNGC